MPTMDNYNIFTDLLLVLSMVCVLPKVISQA